MLRARWRVLPRCDAQQRQPTVQPATPTCLSTSDRHARTLSIGGFWQFVPPTRRRLDAHIHWCNHGRTHHALGGLLVPADRYYGRVEEVLARIEAGTGRDASDLLDLRDRCLELFKVTSRGGVPEVWLLGQRLLGASTQQ